jgi:NAD(P)-dependent dehydrogenase (short-subunit alcohol dehydrogenase family)
MIHYGFNEHNMGFPGTINVREEVFMDFCYDVGHSFVRQGFDRIMYVNGHGSNQMLCNLVARRLVNTTPVLAAAMAYWNLAQESEKKLRESEYPGGMAHGCEFETSIYMYLKPELVQRDKMVAETPSKISRFIYDDLFGSGPVHFVNRWSRVTASGVEGDPFKATPEKGKAFTEEVITNLILLDVNANRGREYVHQLQAVGSEEPFFIPCDLERTEQIEPAIGSVVEQCGRIDVLVNNAAVSLGDAFLETSLEKWQKTIAVNLTAVFVCGQIVARSMVAKRIAGSIINLASVNSFAAEKGAAPYVASKGRVLALTRSMAVDLARYSIRVNAIAPGLITTERSAPIFATELYRVGIERGVLLGRADRPEEVASLALFLASDESSYMTGSAVVVDGGFLSYIRLD